MKAAIEVMRNKEMDSYKASRVFNLPHTTLQSYVKDQESSCEGENDLAEHCLLMKRKFSCLTMTRVMCLAYQLAVRNGIKTNLHEK